MDKTDVIDKLVVYKRLLSQYFEIDQMILFGSYAIGNPRNDSDIDVAVIVKHLKGDFFTYAPLLWKLRREIDDRIEPLLFESDKDESGFLQQIIKTGTVISD